VKVANDEIPIYPTLAELCNLPEPENIQGHSFAPLLQNESYEPREYAYSEYDFCHGVFTQDNRYVGKPPILMVRTDRWTNEFTNVIDDPGNAGIVKELTAIAERTYAL